MCGTPRARLRSTWIHASSKSLEAPQTTDYLQHALITIAYAISNSCKHFWVILFTFSANTLSVEVDWDVTRFADRVKNSRPRQDGQPSVEDTNLLKYFRNPELGDLDDPATIVDRFGRIMVWHLPDIFLHPLIVSSTHLSFCINSYISRIPSIWVLLNSTNHWRHRSYWCQCAMAKNWLSQWSLFSEWRIGLGSSLVPSSSSSQ